MTTRSSRPTGSTSTASGSTRSSDEALAVINPATEEVIGEVPQASVADVDRAVAAARRAFDEGPWPRMSPRERSDVLVRFTQAIADRRAELVDLIIAEAGSARPIAEAIQFDTGLRYTAWFAERAATLPVPRPAPSPGRPARPRPGRDPQGADRRRGRDHARSTSRCT